MNPRRPTPTGLKPAPFGRARAPPLPFDWFYVWEELFLFGALLASCGVAGPRGFEPLATGFPGGAGEEPRYPAGLL